MKRLYLDGKDISGGLKLDDNFVYVPFPEPLEVEFIIVGGGGSGAIRTQEGSGGGGAGGVVFASSSISLGEYPVIVGAGGSAREYSTSGPYQGITGTSSSFLDTTALGGGGGRIVDSGTNGGSGGGSGAQDSGEPPATGGLALQPTSEWGGLGSNGGGSEFTSGGGGGGGATSAGTAAYYIFVDFPANGYGGNGGNGYTWVDGITYAGGGGGSVPPTNLPDYRANQGVGGNGGTTGGNGVTYATSGDSGDIAAKTPGSGGGAGFALNTSSGHYSGKGGDGTVIIRYVDKGFAQASGGITSIDGGYRYHKFDTPGDAESFLYYKYFN